MFQLLPAAHPGKVREERLRRRQMRAGDFRQVERAMQKASRSRGINHELRVNLQRTPAMPPLDDRAFHIHVHAPQLRFVEIRRADPLRLLHEKQVEVRPIPVRIREGVARTCGHEQLIGAVGARCEGLARAMLVETEAAFQPAGDVGVRGAPGAPFCEGLEEAQVVPPAEVEPKEIGQWRG